MKKVKEWLDKNLILIGESSCKLRKNGHYSVHGQWIYPENWYNKENKIKPNFYLKMIG